MTELVVPLLRVGDAVASELGVEPEGAPWAREIELRDRDGNRLRIGTARE